MMCQKKTISIKNTPLCNNIVLIMVSLMPVAMKIATYDQSLIDQQLNTIKGAKKILNNILDIATILNNEFDTSSYVLLLSLIGSLYIYIIFFHTQPNHKTHLITQKQLENLKLIKDEYGNIFLNQTKGIENKLDMSAYLTINENNEYAATEFKNKSYIKKRISIIHSSENKVWLIIHND